MPSILQDFEYDIFISYRHHDNRSGWVTEFVRSLEAELVGTIKEPITVYFDIHPHDGILEIHNVDKTLEGKLKSILFIPILSQTYCDPKSFAWQHEFCVFNKQSMIDQFGMDIKLNNGNVISRILPVKIHELDPADILTIENEIGGTLRSIDFIYREPGVNRPLKASDNRIDNLNKSDYHNQINKVSNAVKEIILALRRFHTPENQPLSVNTILPTSLSFRRQLLIGIAAALLLITLYVIYSSNVLKGESNDSETDNGSPIEKSVAVLPFVDMSPDHDQEYFSDGIADEILNALAQLENLKVPGRSSSFRFKGKQEDIKTVGEMLKVNAILDGSVRKQGNRVLITVQLTDVKNGYNLWSQKFERTLDDVFAIQEEIAVAIARKLKVTLLQNEKIEIGEGLSKNHDAYDAYLKGRFFWDQRNLLQSEQYFRMAIKLDSGFALAYAGLSETYVVFPFFGAGTPHEYMPKAQVAAEKAIHLDSMLGQPYLTLAFKNENYDWNPELAKLYYKKALLKNPKYAPSYYWYGHYLINYTDDLSKGVSEMRKSVALDPLGSIHYFNLGFALMCDHKFKEGINILNKSIDLNNRNGNAYVYLANCYIGLNKMDSAKIAFAKADSLHNDRGLASIIYFHMKEGHIDKAQALFNGLINKSKTQYVSDLSLAVAAAFLGKKDIANTYLLKAFESHDVWLPSLINDPTRLPGDLFSDPRNIALMDKYFSMVRNAAYRRQ